MLANGLMYRATNLNEIIGVDPLTGGNWTDISTVSPFGAVLATTGQIPGVDYVCGLAKDATVLILQVK